MTDRRSMSTGPSTPQTAGLASGGAGTRRFRGAGNYLALLPFHLFVGVFLILPTLIVVLGAFHDRRRSTHPRQRVPVVHGHRLCRRVREVLQLAVATAIGAIFGGLLAWAVVRGNPNGILRQLVIAASGVLAQFGGVMLAFAFLATFGFNGLVTLLLRDVLHLDPHRDAPGCTA